MITWMRWNTVKTFSVCWSRVWVRCGENSKISENSSCKKNHISHSQHMWVHLCAWHIYIFTFTYSWDSRNQKTALFHPPRWEVTSPDVCWNHAGYQKTCTLPPYQTLNSSWPWTIRFSSPYSSLLICKMKLLILLSLAKCIWDALISHEMGRISCETSYTCIYNPQRCIMEMRTGKVF